MRDPMRRGVTFTEVLVATAILGLAMAPAVGALVKTFSQIQSEKSESIAAAYAGKLLNQILFELSFDEVLSKTNTPNFKFSETSGFLLDGCTMKWNIEVEPVSGLTFRFMRPEYHAPDPGGERGTVVFQQSGDSGVTTPTRFNRTVDRIDSKFAGQQVLCDVRLTIEWISPGETYSPERKQVLFTRKARVE